MKNFFPLHSFAQSFYSRSFFGGQRSFICKFEEKTGWTEVDHYDQPLKGTLKGFPNMREFKEKTIDDKGNVLEKTTEDPNTPEGRNIIRGQAIMLLKMYPYEFAINHDEGTRIYSSDLNDAIRASRLAELELNADGTPKTGDVETDKIEMALTLKADLDNFRNYVTTEENGVLKWNEPKKVSENWPETEKGRQLIIINAQKWLDQNPITGDNDPKRDSKLELKRQIAKMYQFETGEYQKQHPDEPVGPEQKMNMAKHLRQNLNNLRGVEDSAESVGEPYWKG